LVPLITPDLNAAAEHNRKRSGESDKIHQLIGAAAEHNRKRSATTDEDEHAQKKGRVAEQSEEIDNLSNLHAKAWGKQWPQSKGTISKTEICGDESGSVDDDVDEALADKLKVPLEFDYEYFEDVQHLKIALGASGQDFEDTLVIRDEYKKLRQALENDSVNYRAIVVTGHPGIGSYKRWFSSLESNADFFSYLGKTTFLFYLQS